MKAALVLYMSDLHWSLAEGGTRLGAIPKRVPFRALKAGRELRPGGAPLPSPLSGSGASSRKKIRSPGSSP